MAKTLKPEKQSFSKSCFSTHAFKAMWHQFGELHPFQSSRGTHLMNIGDKRLPRARIKQESCMTLIHLEILVGYCNPRRGEGYTETSLFTRFCQTGIQIIPPTAPALTKVIALLPSAVFKKCMLSYVYSISHIIYISL